jgi:hypothetical protein
MTLTLSFTLTVAVVAAGSTLFLCLGGTIQLVALTGSSLE